MLLKFTQDKAPGGLSIDFLEDYHTNDMIDFKLDSRLEAHLFHFEVRRGSIWLKKSHLLGENSRFHETN